MNKVIETIQERSSTRGYTAEPLTQEELNILLHAGLQAPTAANRQEGKACKTWGTPFSGKRFYTFR